MSWLYSQALVAEFSAATSSVGEPSAPSNSTPTPRACLSPDRMTAFSRLSRYGMTFAPLTDDHGAALLTWFLADSRARTSALPAKGGGSMESARACGPSSLASLARFDRVTRSWRTHQLSLLADLDESSVTWPRSGMTRDGLCWELPMLARRISEIGSGSLLPTPLASNTKANHMRSGGRPARSYLPTPTATSYGSNKGGSAGREGQPERLSLQTMASRNLWPTPTSTLGTKGGRVTPQKAREGGTLIEALSARTSWPTPTVKGNYNKAGLSAKSGDGLATAVAKARPAEQAGGSLNPTWVEWLMGWPLGWTAFDQLGMDRYRQWSRAHGANWSNEE